MAEVQTPKQIVEKLDQYVIGQDDAKRAVAVALYNRYRRMQLSPKMQEEITPEKLTDDRTNWCRENRNCTTTGENS